MEGVINVKELMYEMLDGNASPEDILGRAISNLYAIEDIFIRERRIVPRNKIRTTTACVKLLYDFEQQMSLARTYLIHRIRLYDAREQDYMSEISMLRRVTPILDQKDGNGEDGSILQEEKVMSQEQGSASDNELDIILDTRMIKEIDLSKAALMNISDRIQGKKGELLDIEQQMEEEVSIIMGTSMVLENSLNNQPGKVVDQEGVGRTRDFESSNRPRVGDTRKKSPETTINMATQKDKSMNLPSQGALGYPRDWHGGAPDATGSTVYGRESSKGTVGVVSASAPAAQAVTADVVGESPRLTISLERLNDQELEGSSSRGKPLGAKRRARVSPGAITPSEGEMEVEDALEEKTSIRLRRGERLKKACLLDQEDPESPGGDKGNLEPGTRNPGKATEVRLEGSSMASENEATPSFKEEHRRRLRRRRNPVTIASSDEEEEEMAMYAEEEEDRTMKGPKAARRTGNKATRKGSGREGCQDIRRESIDLTNEEVFMEGSEIRQQNMEKNRSIKGKRKEAKSEMEYSGMMTWEIREYILMLLEDAETVRLKTKTMQGGLSGILKDRIAGIRGAVECLVDKLEETRNAAYYKMKNNELMAENKRIRKDYKMAEREKDMKDKEIEAFRNMYEEAEGKYVEAEKRIHNITKGGNFASRDKERVEGARGATEESKEACSRQRMMEAEEMMEIDMEEVYRQEEEMDKRWPAIRPPIRGRSKKLTMSRKSAAPRRINEIQSTTDGESPKEQRVRDESRTRGNYRQLLGGDGEGRKTGSGQTKKIEIINRQSSKLAEGKPRVISDVQIVPPRDIGQPTGKEETGTDDS